jgi:exonuclease SbcC
MGIFSPNASGKSSILDALTFCLFDKSTRAWKAENVMNHSKSNFHCKLEFEVGNDTYIVERLGAINKNGSTRVEVNFSTLSPEGELISLNGDQRNTTNKNIRKLIGTYDDFIMTSFSSQNNSSIFLDQNQTEKKEILGKFLGLSIFDKLFKVAKEESSGIYSMLKNFLDVDYDQQISDIETELKSSITSFNTLEESKTSKESILEKHKNKVIELVKEIRPIDASISDINVLSKELEGQDNDLNTLSENLIQLERNLSKVSDAKELINNRLKSNKFTDIERKIAEHSNIQDDYSKTKIEIDRLKDNVTNKLDKITKLGNLEYDADCSFCMGNIFVKDAIKTKEELVSDKLRANQLITKVKTLDNKLEINKDVPLIHTEFLGLNDELNDLKFSNQTIDAKISSARSNIKLAESNKQIVISNITRCKKYQNDIHHNNKIQQSLDDEKANEQSVYAEVKALTQDLQHSIGKKVSLETRKKELITTIDKVKDLEDKYEAYKYYLMAIDKNGISYDLISKVLVNVETEVNNILSQIVDFQIVFDMDGKNVNNYIVYDNDKSWALEMASGMEKFISTLAIRIALTNISNLPRPNFIAIDEGWGTLDSDNLNSAQQLFQYLKNIYKFSLIISHIDTMRDFTDDLLEISVVDGYSQITF